MLDIFLKWCQNISCISRKSSCHGVSYMSNVDMMILLKLDIFRGDSNMKNIGFDIDDEIHLAEDSDFLISFLEYFIMQERGLRIQFIIPLLLNMGFDE